MRNRDMYCNKNLRENDSTNVRICQTSEQAFRKKMYSLNRHSFLSWRSKGMSDK